MRQYGLRLNVSPECFSRGFNPIKNSKVSYLLAHRSYYILYHGNDIFLYSLFISLLLYGSGEFRGDRVVLIECSIGNQPDLILLGEARKKIF